MAEENKTVLTEKWKNILITIAILSIMGIGFILGRCTTEVKTNTITKYIKGDTIREIIYKPKPYKVEVPIDTLNLIKQWIKDGVYSELWPTKTVTKYVEINKTDSAQVIKDWSTKRLYAETLFKNDTLGTCSINAEVQYNRLRLVNYSYEPVTREVVKEIRLIKKFEPFIGVSYLTNPWEQQRNSMIGVAGGFFIKEHYGLMVQFQHSLNTKSDYIGATLCYKF